METIKQFGKSLGKQQEIGEEEEFLPRKISALDTVVTAVETTGKEAPVHVSGEHLHSITNALSGVLLDRQRVDNQIVEIASRLEFWYNHVLRLGEVVEGMRPATKSDDAMGVHATTAGTATKRVQTQSLIRQVSTATQSLAHFAQKPKGKGPPPAVALSRNTGRLPNPVIIPPPSAAPGLLAMTLEAPDAQKLTELYDEATLFATEISGMLSTLVEEKSAFLQTARQIQLQLLLIQSVPATRLANRLATAFQEEAAKQATLVQFSIHGEETLVDKTILEDLYEPLLTLIKHNLKRSIEDSSIRALSGKPPTATLSLVIQHEGGRIRLTLQDDGYGMDPAQIHQSALTQGKILPNARWDGTALTRLLCNPALNPAINPSNEKQLRLSDPDILQGVQRRIHQMRGSISLEAFPGRGCTWEFLLPANPTTCEGVIVDAGNSTQVVLPSTYVQGGFELDTAQITWKEGRPFYPGPFGESCELWRLDWLLGVTPPEHDPAEGVYIETQGVTLALAVHKIVACRDILAKSLSAYLDHHPLFSSAGFDLDANLVLVANVPGLFQTRFDRLAEVELAKT